MQALGAISGLTSEDAALRQRQAGFNELPAPDRRGFLRIVGEVNREPMFALLVAGESMPVHKRASSDQQPTGRALRSIETEQPRLQRQLWPFVRNSH